MPIKRPQLANNEIYHIVARGIEGRNIFINETDYYRAIHDIFEFNDSKSASWQHRRFNASEVVSRTNPSEKRLRTIAGAREPRDFIVNILAFCLMPNHIHFLLKQLQEGGISKFMQKMGTGYANYFNNKYERSGHLFQGRFKAVHIKTDLQLKNVFVYIHTNPAALIDENWKEGGVKNVNKIIDFIENYKWSSYSDYLGKDNFPSVTQREFFNEIMPKEKWRDYVNDWVQFKGFESLRDVALE